MCFNGAVFYCDSVTYFPGAPFTLLTGTRVCLRLVWTDIGAVWNAATPSALVWVCDGRRCACLLPVTNAPLPPPAFFTTVCLPVFHF